MEAAVLAPPHNTMVTGMKYVAERYTSHRFIAHRDSPAYHPFHHRGKGRPRWIPACTVRPTRQQLFFTMTSQPQPLLWSSVIWLEARSVTITGYPNPDGNHRSRFHVEGYAILVIKHHGDTNQQLCVSDSTVGADASAIVFGQKWSGQPVIL